ncbi:hypothetical protein PGT21_020973 [Puccinia graminis f. sp. tritici]|uniref:Secreted protein n=1 Tax=Puccinia graminis f. sp. tritici TaxID=56615 RepID=A0A5B0LMF0_PUCGR|nr:hypothetical protein PGT21_020973 [Puccinia graminis f. sp. tritici]
MLFAISLSLILMVLLIQTDMAHANFLCNDKGTIRNRKATLGHCLRRVNDADLRSKSGPFLKKENAKWLMTLAPPGKKRGFTCEHVKIDGFPITREFCCRPKTKDPLVFGKNIPATQAIIDDACYRRDGPPIKGGRKKGPGH